MPGKRNFTSYSQIIQQQGETSDPTMVYRSNKKLRRLPHVFSKVLELPFNSDKDVYIEDRNDCLKFVATTDTGIFEAGGGIHVTELYPGITKVVVRKRGTPSQPFIDELHLNVWRFRLPATARPELATVDYARGQLVVTVPKNGKEGDYRRPEFKGNMGSLVTVH